MEEDRGTACKQARRKKSSMEGRHHSHQHRDKKLGAVCRVAQEGIRTRRIYLSRVRCDWSVPACRPHQAIRLLPRVETRRGKRSHTMRSVPSRYSNVRWTCEAKGIINHITLLLCPPYHHSPARSQHSERCSKHRQQVLHLQRHMLQWLHRQ